jgi:hypothetical protein
VVTIVQSEFLAMKVWQIVIVAVDLLVLRPAAK